MRHKLSDRRGRPEAEPPRLKNSIGKDWHGEDDWSVRSATGPVAPSGPATAVLSEE